MNNHKNALLTVHGRLLLTRRITDEVPRPEEATKAMDASARTAYKWLRRYLEEGKAGLQNPLIANSIVPTCRSSEGSQAGLEHRRARSYIPNNNGKAVGFMQA